MTNFSFKTFKIMTSLRSLTCLNTTVELTFTTQKANSCSPWTTCFQLEIRFWVNLVQKLKIISLSWNCVPRLIPWWCSTFLFSTGKYLFGQIWSKKSKFSVWAENLHLTNLNMQNYEENMWCSLFLFYTRKMLFGQIWSKKLKLSVKAEIWYLETNLNMWNSMMLTFSVFDRKYLSVEIWSKN